MLGWAQCAPPQQPLTLDVASSEACHVVKETTGSEELNIPLWKLYMEIRWFVLINFFFAFKAKIRSWSIIKLTWLVSDAYLLISCNGMVIPLASIKFGNHLRCHWKKMISQNMQCISRLGSKYYQPMSLTSNEKCDWRNDSPEIRGPVISLTRPSWAALESIA